MLKLPKPPIDQQKAEHKGEDNELDFFVPISWRSKIKQQKHARGCSDVYASLKLAFGKLLTYFKYKPTIPQLPGLRPDLYAEIDGRNFYIEYDGGTEWFDQLEKKIKLYRELEKLVKPDLIYVIFVCDSYRKYETEEEKFEYQMKRFSDVGNLLEAMAPDRPFMFFAVTKSVFDVLPYAVKNGTDDVLANPHGQLVRFSKLWVSKANVPASVPTGVDTDVTSNIP